MHVSFRGEFDSVAQQIDQYLRQAVLVQQNPCGHLGADVDLVIQLSFMGLVAQGLKRLPQHQGQVDDLRMQGQLAQTDLRKIQQVIDDRQQMRCSVLGAVDKVFGFFGQLFVVMQQAQIANNCIKRGTHIVADHGQKFVFVRVCGQQGRRQFFQAQVFSSQHR